MKLKYLLSVMLAVLCSVALAACKSSGDPEPEPGTGNNPDPGKENFAEQNLLRAIEIADAAFENHFEGNTMKMARYYNPYTGVRSSETGSIWMYTAAIEAVNAVLHGLKALKDDGQPMLYNNHFDRYAEQLYKLYDAADFYLGTFSLVSYTQTKSWSVYAVNRGSAKGGANVTGVLNVYDDQMWLVREYVEAYKLTGNAEYLAKAEYLTEYVLDGWDCTRASNGEERGGIPWGPGYVTKHSCSNGPMVSPLVWLYELYKDRDDDIEYRYIDATDRQTRRSEMRKKSVHYLDFAKRIYAWQKHYLLRPDNGVYDDMMGGCSPGSPSTERINNVTYRRGITCADRVGPPITYNSGTMLSGAADLYRATGEASYLNDAKDLVDKSFSHFAVLGQTKPGYYTYDLSGFRNWFNGVLMRGYADIYSVYSNASVCLKSFQDNLDYGYKNYLYKHVLPTNLLVGWSREASNNNVEGMFAFAFAAEYAVLAKYELEKE
jgi:predicted alpha-1,6-mannanase (GH76 family)